MNIKTRIKVNVDIVMTGMMLLLMVRQITGDAAHEWMGMGIFVLFILHHGLNLHWWKRLFKGQYKPYRVAQTAIDVLLLFCMLGLMISGIILSRHVFSFLSLQGGASFARVLHLISSYWSFILISVHIGLHWGMMLSMMHKAFQKPSLLRVFILRLCAAAISGYGLYVFLKNDIADYLFLRSIYVYFDFTQNPLVSIAEYLAIMVLLIAASYYPSKLLLSKVSKKGGSNED